MEEGLIAISQLNDFTFCPASIYFHNLYGMEERRLFQRKDQINGTAAHSSIDDGSYSTRKSILMGMDVYCEKYGLIGKIDIYNSEETLLVERKKKVHRLYEGFIYQLYAQFFSLQEMGYEVRRMLIHSMDDNKNYHIPLPNDDIAMTKGFVSTIAAMRSFNMGNFEQTSPEKCTGCIYEPICDRSLM